MKRKAARKDERRPQENRQRKSIAGGRWRAGRDKTADRKREADRTDGDDGDDCQ